MNMFRELIEGDFVLNYYTAKDITNKHFELNVPKYMSCRVERVNKFTLKLIVEYRNEKCGDIVSSGFSIVRIDKEGDIDMYTNVPNGFLSSSKSEGFVRNDRIYTYSSGCGKKFNLNMQTYTSEHQIFSTGENNIKYTIYDKLPLFVELFYKKC